MKSWEILARKELVDASPWLKLYKETVRREDGTIISDYYTIDQRDFAVIFAQISDDEILCIRHYKHGAKRVNLGLPAGYLEPGESPVAAAKRELLEETGFVAQEWQRLGAYVVDGNRGCGNVHVFFARHLVKKQEPNPDDLETISLETIRLDDLPALLLNGEIATLGAAIGISLGLLKVKQNNKE